MAVRARPRPSRERARRNCGRRNRYGAPGMRALSPQPGRQPAPARRSKIPAPHSLPLLAEEVELFLHRAVRIAEDNAFVFRFDRKAMPTRHDNDVLRGVNEPLALDDESAA